MRLLLVEDQEALADCLAKALRQGGHAVDVMGRGDHADHALATQPYDLAILDLNLPGIDGLEVLRRLREQGSFLPVLMLTARDGVEDRVDGLEAGADDYLLKPFAIDELIARLRALVRRHEFRRNETLSLAALRFDAGARRAFIGEQAVHLTARECVVLQYLLLKAGQVVTREQLTALIPGWAAASSENALELLVSRLRAKIEPGGVNLRTVRGLGYRLEPAEVP